MNFGIGNYLTRKGQKARIYATDGEIGNELHGAILFGIRWRMLTWNKEGRVFGSSGYDSPCDLECRHEGAEIPMGVFTYDQEPSPPSDPPNLPEEGEWPDERVSLADPEEVDVSYLCSVELEAILLNVETFDQFDAAAKDSLELQILASRLNAGAYNPSSLHDFLVECIRAEEEEDTRPTQVAASVVWLLSYACLRDMEDARGFCEIYAKLYLPGFQLARNLASTLLAD